MLQAVLAAARASARTGGRLTLRAHCSGRLLTSQAGISVEEEERRAALLRRYWERAPSEARPIDRIPPQAAASADVAVEGTDEEYSEMWKDYVSYMTNQRDKGWKT